MPSSHLILSHPLLLLPQSLPASESFPMSQLFAWGGQSTFSFSICPSKEHLGLISFRMDWLDLLAVQGTLKSLLQHHSSKASILWCSAFFKVQLSQSYMTTEKTIALTRWTFVGKVMSLLLNKLALELKPKTRDLREKKLPELNEVSWLDWVSLKCLNFLCDAECRLGNKFSFYIYIFFFA